MKIQEEQPPKSEFYRFLTLKKKSSLLLNYMFANVAFIWWSRPNFYDSYNPVDLTI